MGVEFTSRESTVLYSLLAENTSDIILKTDREGYIRHASRAAFQLGFSRPGELVGWHILDLVHPASAAAVRTEHEGVIAGRVSASAVEFAAVTRDDRQRWFEIRLGSLADGDGGIYGAVCIMRSIEERKALEDQVFAAGMTDPLTGLTNRRAFMLMLRHLVERRIGGSVALFDIDHFKAINMEFGQAFGDEVLVVFADLLRTRTRSQDILSRVGGESLAVLMPGATPDQAGQVCRRIITAFAETGRGATRDGLSLTVSAGVAAIGDCLDDTMRRSELALFFAKAKGRNRLELDMGQSYPFATGPRRLAG